MFWCNVKYPPHFEDIQRKYSPRVPEKGVDLIIPKLWFFEPLKMFIILIKHPWRDPKIGLRNKTQIPPCRCEDTAPFPSDKTVGFDPFRFFGPPGNPKKTIWLIRLVHSEPAPVINGVRTDRKWPKKKVKHWGEKSPKSVELWHPLSPNWWLRGPTKRTLWQH